jgi:hypothetical protein
MFGWRVMSVCTCSPPNPPWWHVHITSCPIYTWDDARRRRAWENYYRDRQARLNTEEER